ncbi:LUD domain-containing protein [Patescibacteria group bacterium]|nr:LUD domain-containing protein [Patescibacteria group bacterium]
MNKKFVTEYIEKRSKALSSKEAEELRDKLYNLKKTAIDNLDEYVKKAKSSLEKNGCHVYLAKSNQEAIEELKKIIGDEKYIVKSKSNTINKLKIDEKLKAEIVETDTGDFIAALAGKKDPHPVIPALSLTEKEISKAIKEKLSKDVEPKAEKIVEFVRNYLREKMLSAKVGLTGANVITTQGQIVILENEGNISIISHVPEKHIVVAGIDKIVKDMDEANKVVKAAAVWGTGQDWPNYVNVISGPSKTGDIQNIHIEGAHGAQEVHVILIENDKYEVAKGKYKDKLFCINCGACYDLCPVYNAIGQIPKPSDFERNYKCTLCSNCALNCPVKIDRQSNFRNNRKDFNKLEKIPQANKKMIENVRKYGNPFGEIKDGDTPKELYCC